MRGSSADIGRGLREAGTSSFIWVCTGSKFNWLFSRACLTPIFFALLGSAAALAQQPSEAPKTEAPKSERNLITRTGWVRLEIVGGRIAVLGHRCGQSRVVQVGEPAQFPFEQLSVQLHTESLVIHYEELQANRTLTLDLDDQQRLTLTRTAASPTDEVKLVQPFQGPLTLTVGREQPQTFTAATVWHLALQQPQLCEESLFPSLELLRPHWRLKEQAAGIQKELLGHAGKDVLAERAQWRKWVAQLDSDDFEERQAADQHLRSAGQGVVAWLRRLDRKQLTAEQAGRIQDICQGLADLSTDTPQRVSAWLVDDRYAWMSLLRHEEADIRLAAANHLTLLFGQPLAFNPLGDLSARERQLAQLQLRYGKP